MGGIRHLSGGKQKKKKKGEKDEPSLGSYKTRKDVAKQKRLEAWETKQRRVENLKTRREGKPERGVMSKQFRSWWDPQSIYHDKLIRDARREGKPWRIRVAAFVERLPVVIPDPEPFEEEYYEVKSYLGTFGKEYPPETGFMSLPNPSDHLVMPDAEMLAQLPFTPAPRETEADETGEVKTLERRLKERVFLTVQTDKEGNMSGPRWTFPSAIAKEDETLLSTAQRAVAESIGEDLELYCAGNAPMAVNLRPYNKNLPEEFRENYYGEKIFYYRVQHDDGDVNEEVLSVDDYAWLTREEIVERVGEERGQHQAKFFHYML